MTAPDQWLCSICRRDVRKEPCEHVRMTATEVLANQKPRTPVRKHAHYFRDVSHLQEVDVYRVLELFGVTDPCLQHAVKKLLSPGRRGTKTTDRDVLEAVDTLERWLEMRAEDGRHG